MPMEFLLAALSKAPVLSPAAAVLHEDTARYGVAQTISMAATTGSKSGAMPDLRIVYLPFRAMAETTRFILEYGNIPYTDEVVWGLRCVPFWPRPDLESRHSNATQWRCVCVINTMRGFNVTCDHCVGSTPCVHVG